jgi:hypothetical protein
MRKGTHFCIVELQRIQQIPQFKADLWVLLTKFADGNELKYSVKRIIWDDLPLVKAISPTWLTYHVCNEIYDADLDGYFLSELVADMEYLIQDIEILIEKYKKLL